MKYSARLLWIFCITIVFNCPLKAQNPSITFIDSTKLYKKESLFAWSSPTVCNISDSTIAIVKDGNKSNDIKVYNKFSGKIKNIVKYNFNYRTIISKILSNDTAKINFALKYNTTKGFNPYDVFNLEFRGDQLLVSGDLYYALKGGTDPVKKNDSVIIHKILLFSLISPNKELPENYYIVQTILAGNYSLSDFVFENDSAIIGNLFEPLSWEKLKKMASHQTDSIWVVAKYKLNKKDSSFESEHIIPLSTPNYSIKHNLIGANSVILFKFRDSVYAQYCYLTFLKSIENNSLITLPDTAYKKSVFEGGELQLLNYIVRYVYPTSDGKSIYYLQKESEHEYLVKYNRDFKEVARAIIPVSSNDMERATIILSDNYLSIITDTGKYYMLYNYKINL